jgi:hypothetical protein
VQHTSSIALQVLVDLHGSLVELLALLDLNKPSQSQFGAGSLDGLCPQVAFALLVAFLGHDAVDFDLFAVDHPRTAQDLQKIVLGQSTTGLLAAAAQHTALGGLRLWALCFTGASPSLGCSDHFVLKRGWKLEQKKTGSFLSMSEKLVACVPNHNGHFCFERTFVSTAWRLLVSGCSGVQVFRCFSCGASLWHIAREIFRTSNWSGLGVGGVFCSGL